MKNRLYRLLPAMLVLFLLCSAVDVLAAEKDMVDWSKKGAVSVTLQADATPVCAAELTLYKAADAQIRGNSLCFTYTQAFKDFGGAPEDVRDITAIQRLAAYVKEKGIPGQSAKSDANGTIRINELPLGLYLVVQTGSVEGFSDCTPFLIALPFEENGEWCYEIDATPKTDMVQLIEITVKKVWNDDGKHRPDSVTVQLYKGDTAIDSVTLREQNGWTHTWKNQPKSDDYTVKETVPKGYTAVYQHNGYTYTITNTEGLIDTGQLIWPIPVLAGAGIILFALGWFVWRKKRDA